jgi:hypothetical protein
MLMKCNALKEAKHLGCYTMCYGGLSVPDLKVAGFAVRLCWEWLRRSHPDLSWCGLPRKPEREVQAMF